MLTLPKPDVIITHESDLDGFVSGMLLQRLAEHLFSEAIRLEAWHAQAWLNRPLTETAAWVCDLSFDARMDRPGWLIVDHHPVSRPASRALLVHDPARSASRLCFDLCLEHGLDCQPLARLVELSNIADLFLHEHPDFALASDYAALVKCYHFWSLHEIIDGRLEQLLDHPLLEVMAAKRRIENPLGLACSRRSIQPLSPEVAYVPVFLGNANQIIHELLLEGACPCPVLLTLTRRHNGFFTASLRSRNGEARMIAEKLQGGGHPDASGATLPRNIRNLPDALDYLRRILAPPAAQPVPLSTLNDLLDTFDAGLKTG